MARKYVNAIKAGKMTLGDVPARWREEVLELLAVEA